MIIQLDPVSDTPFRAHWREGREREAVLNSADLQIVRHNARRIVFLVEAVQAAHTVGFAHGEERQPWAPAFQRAAARIYFETVTVEFARSLACAFGECASLMRDHELGVPPIEDWMIVRRYLGSVAEALRSHPGVADHECVEPAGLIPQPTLGILRHDLIAGLVHPEGLERLMRAAKGVGIHCDLQLAGGLSAEELEWLRALADGSRVVDIAQQFGLSRRGMYRALAEIWTKLGVQGRSQGLTLVAEQGLLSR